jgi:hypothetical protein
MLRVGQAIVFQIAPTSPSDHLDSQRASVASSAQAVQDCQQDKPYVIGNVASCTTANGNVSGSATAVSVSGTPRVRANLTKGVVISLGQCDGQHVGIPSGAANQNAVGDTANIHISDARVDAAKPLPRSRTRAPTWLRKATPLP